MIGWADAARIGALLATLGGAGCLRYARPPEPDPVAALAAYRDALVEGRVEDALALIHPRAREGLDREGFAALYRRHRDTLVAQAEALLARARATPPAERAIVRLGEGEGAPTAELVRTPAGWRLLRPVGVAPEGAEGPK